MKPLTDAQKWLLLVLVVLTGWLLYLLAAVLTPFLVAALLAYLGDPLVDRLEKYRLTRTFSIVIVFTIMFVAGLLLLLVLIPLIENQFVNLIQRLSQFISWLQDSLLPGIAANLGMDAGNINLEQLKQSVTGHWKDLGSIAGIIIKKISQSGQVLISWFAFLILVPVVTFYLLRDWDLLIERIRTLVPRQHEATVSSLARECDAVLAEFMRGQLTVMLCLSVIYTFGLWVIGLELSLLIGLLAGLVSFVPYMGFIVGIGVAGIAAFMQFHDVIHLIYVVIVFGVGQALEGMLLSPVLVGDRIGLHPVAVIFAVMAGGQLFGFFGVLLALPAAAVIVVLLRHAHQEYLESDFYTP